MRKLPFLSLYAPSTANSKGVFSGLCRKACVRGIVLLLLLVSVSFSQTIFFSTPDRPQCRSYNSGSKYKISVYYTITSNGLNCTVTCSNILQTILPVSSPSSYTGASLFITASGASGTSTASAVLTGSSGDLAIPDYVGGDGSKGGYLDFTAFCSFHSSLLPQCSEFQVLPTSRCNDGTALIFQANQPNGQIIMGNSFPGQSSITVPITPQPQTDTVPRPDGSLCLDNTSGGILNWIVCPSGFVDDCGINPELPSCNQSSSSSSEEETSSSSNNEASSSSVGLPDICEDFPDLPGCSDSGDSSGSGVGDEDGDCTNLNNCNWARIDIQLIELGVAVEIRNKIGEIAGLAQAGYNLSQEQTGILNGVLNAVNSGNANVVGAIGSGTNNIVNAINDLANGLSGNGGTDSGTISEGVAEGLSQWGSDTTGMGEYGYGDGDFSGNCDGGFCGQMVDSLGDGTGVRNKIRNSIPLDSNTFNFLGRGGDCPVWDMSFAVSVMRGTVIGCTNDCRIDLCDVYGFNAASVIRAFIWLVVSIGTLFMNLEILKRGGR